MKNKNFGRKRQAIYILSNRKSTRIIKTLMDFFFFIKVKIKMVCFSVPSSEPTSEQPKKSAEGATMTKEKPSVREELRKIKESRKEQKAEINTSVLDKSGASDRAKSANGKTEHKQPQRKKKKPKSKETR